MSQKFKLLALVLFVVLFQCAHLDAKQGKLSKIADIVLVGALAKSTYELILAYDDYIITTFASEFETVMQSPDRPDRTGILNELIESKEYWLAWTLLSVGALYLKKNWESQTRIIEEMEC